MSELFAPGMRVILTDQPDWGEGQVQSAIGTRVTVNFEHAGKVVLDVAVAKLTRVADSAGRDH